MVGYRNKKYIRKFFLDLSFAENEGLGMWYEYLAKLRIYPSGHKMKVLVLGLPEKYGLGVDNLLFLMKGASSLTIVDNRPHVLANFKKIANNFLKNDANLEILNVDDFTKTNFKRNSFDLVCSSEVLQQFSNYIEVIQEMIRVSKKYVIFFVSNKFCYAHPKFSGLNSYSLKEVKNELKKIRQIEIKKAGYVDIPPYPSGINVSHNKRIKKSFWIGLVKKILIFITPVLIIMETVYPPPLRQCFAHFIFFKLEKNG